MNDLNIKYAHRRLYNAYIGVPDPIHTDLLIFFSFDTVRQNQTSQIIKHFDLDLICDVISDPEMNEIGFPSVNFPAEGNTRLSSTPKEGTPFEFCKPSTSSRDLRVGGDKNSRVVEMPSQARVNDLTVSQYSFIVLIKRES